MPQRTCSVAGCPKAHRARGLCATHYNQTRYTAAQRHIKVLVPCRWCATPTSKDRGREKRYGGLFCSLACRDTWRTRQVELRKLPALFVGTVIRPQLPAAKPAPKPRTWVAGNCAWCRTSFLDRQPGARFCSPLCGRRYWRKRYKEQTGVSDAIRRQVYERDRWRCQICRRSIRKQAQVPHPLAATVDHIVPRSHGGGHGPANLRAAHFICNALRGNRGGGEQLLLFG